MTSQSRLNRGYLHPFWNGSNGRYLYGVGELPRTLIELAMCRLSAVIRRSDEWWEKLHDAAWKEGWLEYGLDTQFSMKTSSGLTQTLLNVHQVQYVLDELQGYAALRDDIYQVSCFERIWETTTTLDLQLRDSLERHLIPIDHGTHEESSFKLIVNPYLFPVVYGRTLSIDTSGDLASTPAPRFSQHNYTLSPNYACIPTSFTISSDKPYKVTALSYINGIDPWRINLYRDIEELLGTSRPLFEHVLTDLHRSNLLWHRIPGTCRYTTWDEPLTPQHSDDEEGWLDYQREIKQWTLERPIQYPDIPKDGYTGGLEERKVKVTLSGRTINVIVKVTNITLTPNSPHFGGTSWHAEGMRNERVVACAVYCVAMSNVSPISLCFRMPVQAPKGYASDDEGATIRTWGLKLASSSHQYLGSASLRLGHGVAFPNVYQHRFGQTYLEDPAKPGSLTLLTFALVDPEITEDRDEDTNPEVLSTAEVPPQQASWIRRALEESLDVRIPTEVIDRIMQHTEGLMSDEEAHNIAEKMKQERVRFWKQHDELWFSLPFNGLDA